VQCQHLPSLTLVRSLVAGGEIEEDLEAMSIYCDGSCGV
jgi:hypothetical protein